MKQSIRIVLALGIGALALQGYARAQQVQTTAAPTTEQAVAAPVAAAATATVPQENGKPVIRADTKENFEAVAAAIRQQMQRGGRWEFVSNVGRQTIDQRFADMQRLFDQYGSVDKMDASAKSKLLDDQKVINEALVRYDGNRLVCAEETPTGTHFPKRVCRTYSEIQRQQNDAQFMMRQNSKNHPLETH